MWNDVIGLFALFSLIVFIAYYIWLVLFIITDDRSTDTTLMWLVILFVLPFVGLALYYFLGRDYRDDSSALHKKMRHAMTTKRAKIFPSVQKPYRAFVNQFFEHRDPDIITTAKLIERSNDSTVMPATNVAVYDTGEAFFRELKKSLRGAKQYINMMYYIWEKDELTREITDILLAKLKAGVRVRILHDALGSLPYNKSELKELKTAGAQVAADNASISLVNFRNHHKITVVGSEVAFTGGHNVGQEYIDGAPRYDSWRDTSIKLTGPALLGLQDIFALRWYLKTGEDLYTKTFFPAMKIAAGSKPVQTTHSSVEYKWETVKQVYLKLLLSANERVFIQSPYFIPDQTFVDALVTAALSGVDVQVMMTGVPDKKISWWAAQAYFRKPLEAGVKIYMYNAGFFHAKTLLVDDEVVSIGTMNFDMRSFNLQKENTCLVYDKEIIKEHVATYHKDLAESSAYTLDDYRSQHVLAKLRNGLCKIPSRLF